MRFIDGGRHGVSRHGVRRCIPAGRSGGCYLGQPEIQHLGVPALGDKDVGRLDVAMDDTLGMRGVQSVGNLRRQREQSFVI